MAEVGDGVSRVEPGEPVCVHYLASCGQCHYCKQGTDQFCVSAQMIGKHRDGGYAEFILMPESSLFKLPQSIPFEQGAILMCSAATALHALRKARVQSSESVAVFGIGGLGASAVQLAKALGASDVYAVDLKPGKLDLARRFGAQPINAGANDPVSEIKRLTGGRGVDVSLELVGLPLTMRQAVQVLAIHGRAALAGITRQHFEVAPYEEVIKRESEIIGVSDHLAAEIPELLNFVLRGSLNVSSLVTRTLPLDAKAINGALDELEKYGDAVRMVVVP